MGRSRPFFSSQSESLFAMDAFVIEKGPLGTDVIAFSGLETERSNGQKASGFLPGLLDYADRYVEAAALIPSPASAF